MLYTGFVTPSEESADSGHNGARQVVNGICVQPQTTHNEDGTRGSKVSYGSVHYVSDMYILSYRLQLKTK